MKRSSLQWKLTLWFPPRFVLMAVLTFIVVFFVSHSVLQKQLRTELIHTVEDNVDEVEFYRSIAQMNQTATPTTYIRYGVGLSRNRRRFSRSGERHDHRAYHENGSLLYGETPIAAAGMLGFLRTAVLPVVRGETSVYFDRRLEQNPFAICGCAAPCPKRGPTRCATSYVRVEPAGGSRSSPLPAAC